MIYDVKLIGFKKFRYPSCMRIKVEAENVSEAKEKALKMYGDKNGYDWFIDDVKENQENERKS